MKQTVYDADGKEHVVEAVDAREYVESGSYFKDKPVKTEPKVEVKVEPKVETKTLGLPVK